LRGLRGFALQLRYGAFVGFRQTEFGGRLDVRLMVFLLDRRLEAKFLGWLGERTAQCRFEAVASFVFFGPVQVLKA
jgi:hypothetical protein